MPCPGSRGRWRGRFWGRGGFIPVEAPSRQSVRTSIILTYCKLLLILCRMQTLTRASHVCHRSLPAKPRRGCLADQAAVGRTPLSTVIYGGFGVERARSGAGQSPSWRAADDYATTASSPTFTAP